MQKTFLEQGLNVPGAGRYDGTIQKSGEMLVYSEQFSKFFTLLQTNTFAFGQVCVKIGNTKVHSAAQQVLTNVLYI